MAKAGQTDVARAWDLAGHPLHHRGWRVAIMLGGKAQDRHLNICKASTLIEMDDALNGRSISICRSRRHDRDRARTPFGIRVRAYHVVDDGWCEIGHGSTVGERCEAIGDEFLLK